MGRKHQKKPLPKDVPSIVHRIIWLMENHWGGNIAFMAKALGVSHAGLSRVVNGQIPSGKMLEALARRPDINIRWVLANEGDALVERGQGTVGSLCPVATELLAGSPRDHQDKLSPFSLPVASPLLLESPYWYCLAVDDAITKDRRSRVAVGDYVLIETSPRWTRHASAYAGQIVVLRVPERGVILGRVGADELPYEINETQYEVNTFGEYGVARMFPKLTRSATATRPPETLTRSPEHLRLYGDDVVGVCLLLARLFGQRE